MKKILFTLFFIAFLFSGKTQSTTPVVNDTASFPYWIQMMQDPGANFYATQRAFNLYWQGRPITKGSGWKVFKRWEYMMQSRINADGTIPDPSSVYKEYNRYIRDNRSSNGNWVNLGPSTIPAPGPAGYEGLGRLNVVAFHPTDANKLYVGSPSGGFWKSEDAGATWLTTTDTLPTLGVSSIVVDYSNPDKILIGTGDRDAGDAPGLGVFLSTNGGMTWAPYSTGMGNVTVGKLIQHPSNPQQFLAATSGGVYKTTDGGATWILTQSGNFKDIVFKPSSPSTVYAAAGADFYKSTNGAGSFTKITNGLTSGQRGTIAVTPANPAYVYFLQSDGSSGFKGLYRSTDSGDSFTTRSTSPNILDWSCDGSGTGGQGWYDLALAADPVNPEIIYAGGVDVWRSITGGTTWNINSHWYGGCTVPAVHADCHYLAFSPVNNKLYAGNDGGIYSTSNGGLDWTDHTVGMTIGQIYKLGQSQTVREKAINGFQDNGTYTITPSGWVATGGGDGMECAIDFTNAAYTYHTIYYGDIYRKYNNMSEKHIAGDGIYGITESGGWVTPFILNAADPKGMFVGYKNVWRCFNVIGSTLTWQKISDLGTGVDMADLEQSSADYNILYAARGDSKLFRSDNCLDPDPVWIDLTSSLPGNSVVTDIETHPNDPDIVYITVSNQVYKSDDRGATWVTLTDNLPNIHLNAIVYYKNSIDGLYVGSDAGVYYRDPSTSGWISFNEGMPASARVTELDIYYDNDSVSQDALRASTYGRGLWTSDLFHSAPVANFEADKTLIPVGCGVNFTDLSGGVPTEWSWTFEGGTPSSSSEKHPSGIVYNDPGTYMVKLVISNQMASDSITKLDYITVSNNLAPAVNFSSDKNALCIGDVVTFTDETDFCPSSWSWEFTPSTITYLEGTHQNSQNPIVQFNQPGPYDVKLTAYNSTGSGTLVKPDYILNGGYTVPFGDDFETGFATKNWTIGNPDANITWDTTTIPGASVGSKSAWINFFDYVGVNRRDQLISPPFDLTNLSGATLSFNHSYAQRATIKDSLIVYLSNDCGNNWTRVLSLGPDGTPNIFVTHENTVDEFFPLSSNDWCGGSFGVSCYQIDLTPYAGQNNIMVMFESVNRRGNNLFLDDVTISPPVGTVEHPVSMESLKAYPNPTTGMINIVLYGISADVPVTLFNMQGQVVQQGTLHTGVNNGKGNIDLTGLQPGIYYLKAVTLKETHIQKIILE